MLLIISTLSYLSTTLWFIYSTFIHISSGHFFNSFVPNTCRLLKSWHEGAALLPATSSFQHEEKQKIYPRQESRCQCQHDAQQLQWGSPWQFRIQLEASSATIQESNVQVAIKSFRHIITWKTTRGNWIYLYVGRTFISWASGGLYCLRGGE